MTAGEVNILTPKERQRNEGREIVERVKRRAEEELALQEEIRAHKLRPACPDCGTDNVHITVTTSQAWDVEAGDWDWDEPFCTDGHVICGDCEKVIRPVFKQSTETPA
jgi:hypothetical protein